MKTARHFIILCFFNLIYTSGFTYSLEPGIVIQVTIDEGMEEHLLQLPEYEQKEQLRDWVVLAYFKRLQLNESEFFETFFDYSPLRNDFKLPLVDFKYGESRAVALQNGNLHIFVPKGSTKRKVYIARASDEYRMLHLKKPTKIFQVEYELPVDSESKATFSLEGEVSVADVFSPAFGYYSKVVSNSSTLKELVNSVDDISHLQRLSNGAIKFGGRKFKNFPTRNVKVEDIAALYQADFNAEEELEKRIGKRGLKAEYEDYVQHNIDENIRLNPHLGLRPRYVNVAEFKQLFPYEDYYQENLAEFKKNINIGFSLDPKLREKKCSEDLIRIANGDRDFFDKWFGTFLKKQITNSYLLGSIEEIEPISGESDSGSDFWSYVLGIKNEKELTVNTLLFGAEPEAEDKVVEENYDNLNRVLQNASGITDEKIKAHLDNEKELMYKTIITHRSMLIEIANSIAEGDNMPFFRYRAFLKGIFTFELSVENKVYKEIKIKEPEAETIQKLIFDLALLTKKEAQFDFLETSDNPKQELYDYVQSLGLNPDQYFENKKYVNDNYFDQFVVPDLVELLVMNGYQINEGKKIFDEELSMAVGQFQQEVGLDSTGRLDDLTFKVLLNQFPSLTKKDEFSRLSSFLFDWYQSNSYQFARYDGFLQGTEVGMNLFYTDLVMKLWGFDYQGTAPSNLVPGFLSKADRKISFTFFEDYAKYPSTRSWLNELESAYESAENELWFAHCITRIFNASSSNLEPGREVGANYRSFLFANWWNKNFSAVADYEQEYHKLNQIMKWTTIINWLKINNKFKFLNQVKVQRDLNFADWYKAKESKLKVSVPLPFIDSRLLNEKTECLHMIPSKPFFAFENEWYINRYSGGVSLPTKLKLVSRIKNSGKVNKFRNSGFNRPGINLSLTSKKTNLNYFNNKNIRIDLAKQTATTSSGKITKLNGKNLELHNSTLNSEISKKQGDLSITEKNGEHLIAEVKIQGSGDKVHLSVKKGELLESVNILSEANKVSIRNNLHQLGKKLDVFQLETGEYFINLSSSGKFLRLKKGGDITWDIDIRIAKNQDRLTQKVNYLDGKIIEKTGFTKELKNYKWYQVSRGYNGGMKKRFTNVKPSENDIKINISDGHQSVNARISYNKLSIEKTGSNFEKKLELTRTFEKQLEQNNFNKIIREFDADRGAIKLIKTPQGKVIKVAKEGMNSPAGDLQMFESIISKNSRIENVLIKEGGEIRMLSENTIQVPRNLNAQQKSLVQFIDTKVSSNKGWAEKLVKAKRIETKDLPELSKIHESNLNLVDTYFGAKEIKTLPKRYATLDLNTTKNNPQVVVMRTAGNPEVFNLPKPLSSNINDISLKLEAHYNGKAPLTNVEYKALTKDLANIYEAAKEFTGKQELILANTPHINHSLISKIHNVKGRIINDQTSLEKSIENAELHLYTDFDASIFMSTAPLMEYPYDDIASLSGQVYDLGLPLIDTLTYAGFIDVMGNESIQQVYLLIRTNEDGLVFRDRTLTYEDLEIEMGYLPFKKEMVYIITNNPDKLQQLFANWGQFGAVVTSGFNLGAPSSLAAALRNMLDFTMPFRAKVTLKKSKYKKFKKTFPAMVPIVERLTETEDKKHFNLNIGKLTSAEKKRFSQKALNFLARFNKKGVKGQQVGFKSIKQAVNEIQLKNIEKMNTQKAQNFLKGEFLKSIPNFKVDIQSSLRKAG